MERKEREGAAIEVPLLGRVLGRGRAFSPLVVNVCVFDN